MSNLPLLYLKHVFFFSLSLTAEMTSDCSAQEYVPSQHVWHFNYTAVEKVCLNDSLALLCVIDRCSLNLIKFKVRVSHHEKFTRVLTLNADCFCRSHHNVVSSLNQVMKSVQCSDWAIVQLAFFAFPLTPARIPG